MQVDKALVFAEREGFRALELDLYLPDRGAGHGPRPLLVYLHGGGWRVSHRSRAPRETRGWSRGFFERLTDAGFVVVAPDYRFSGEATFPAQLDDVVGALRWTEANHHLFDADAARTYLWGASAGGHLAALAALTHSPGQAGGRHHPVAPRIAGVVCWYPITDLPALDHDADDIYEAHLLGGPIGQHLDAARAASPVAQVGTIDGLPAPFLLQHGDRDTWVPVDQSRRLADALRAAGGSVELEVVPGADHFFDGAADVEAIFDRAVAFLLGLDARHQRPGN